MENIYSYTEWCIKSRLDLYQKLESKILATLAFSGVTLKVVADLPNIKYIENLPCYTCVGLKTISCLAVITAIVILVLSIRFKLKASTIAPKEFREDDEWYYLSKEEFQKSIYFQWIKMDEEIQIRLNEKGSSLNQSLIALMIAAFAYIADNLLLSYYG